MSSMLRNIILKKVFKNIFIIPFILLLILVGTGKVSASDDNQPILYWSKSCPYCLVVKDKITNEGLDQKIHIQHIEVNESDENVESYKEKLTKCNISLNNATIPMLYVDGKCYRSVGTIMDQLNAMTQGEDTTEEDIEVVDERGKRNTEKLIIGVSIFLVVLPLFGYLLKKTDSSKRKKKSERGKKGKKSKKVFTILLTTSLLLLVAKPTYAICPVCTVAVGAGVGFSRYLGIDDSITGIWIGGLMISSALWLVNFVKSKLKKKSKHICLISFGVFLLTILLFILPLKLGGMIGHEQNSMWGVDKVLLGIIVGSLSFYIGAEIHKTMLYMNGNRVYIPFQKVVVPIFILLLATILFYIIVY
ncbi:MAG: glutaredoxin domain-containing protein [Candidatus Dojkabacteria bacterium]|jgi:glutaredoxin